MAPTPWLLSAFGRWLLQIFRAIKRIAGFPDPVRRTTYTEILLERLNAWTLDFNLLVTMVVLAAAWLLVKLVGILGKPQHGMRRAGNPSCENAKDVGLKDPLFSDGLLQLCGQKHTLKFGDVMNLNDTMFVFLAETHFSEVFLLGGPQGGWVAKIVPLSKTSIGLAAEVRIARELNNLSNREDYSTDVFAKLLGAKCVRDTYPSVLVEKHKSTGQGVQSRSLLGFLLNDVEPFLVIEYAVGGSRFADVMMENLEQIYSIVVQVVWAIAVAEEAIQFEHRDLQMDNILVKMTSSESVSFVFRRKRIAVQTMGVMACIIDFNLSRATIDGVPVYYDPSAHFTADFVEERSCMAFDTMRGALRGNWATFLPETNVQGMLQFLCEVDIFLRNQDYDDLSAIRSLKAELMEYKSMAAFATGSALLPRLLQASQPRCH